jgi:hypothetical protein
VSLVSEWLDKHEHTIPKLLSVLFAGCAAGFAWSGLWMQSLESGVIGALFLCIYKMSLIIDQNMEE